MAVGIIGTSVFKDSATGPFGKAASWPKNSVATPDLFILLSDRRHISFPDFNLFTSKSNVF